MAAVAEIPLFLLSFQLTDTSFDYTASAAVRAPDLFLHKKSITLLLFIKHIAKISGKSEKSPLFLPSINSKVLDNWTGVCRKFINPTVFFVIKNGNKNR